MATQEGQPRLDDLPGYRRRIVISPAPGRVSAALEDDVHCMLVTLEHDGERIIAVLPETDRLPWTTCGGAREVLVRSFTGVPLAQARLPAVKRLNCTHLYDLAVLGAAHAHDPEGFTYDVLASDPIDGEQQVEVRRNGAVLHGWRVREDNIVSAPPEIAGQRLSFLRDWIATLDPAVAEAARVLQWGAMVSHSRTIPRSRQLPAVEMPPSCHTYQPEQAPIAIRNGARIDFTRASRGPLDHFDGGTFREDPLRGRHPAPIIPE